MNYKNYYTATCMKFNCCKKGFKMINCFCIVIFIADIIFHVLLLNYLSPAAFQALSMIEQIPVSFLPSENALERQNLV